MMRRGRNVHLVLGRLLALRLACAKAWRLWDLATGLAGKLKSALVRSVRAVSYFLVCGRDLAYLQPS